MESQSLFHTNEKIEELEKEVKILRAALYFSRQQLAILLKSNQKQSVMIVNIQDMMTEAENCDFSSTADIAAGNTIGSTGQVLTVASGIPSWATPAPTGVPSSLLNVFGNPIGTAPEES